MDFFDVESKQVKSHELQVYPNFKVQGITDLVVKGHSFVAVWDEWNSAWTSNVYKVCELVDKEVNLWLRRQCSSVIHEELQ